MRNLDKRIYFSIELGAPVKGQDIWPLIATSN
nr:MAG TPA: hypothetical protein [Caudoviricetes sp.]